MKEHIKTALLTFLILLSFVQTGLLWYSSPSYEGNKQLYVTRPQIGSEKYNKKQMYELVAPHQIIWHHSGATAWILPEQNGYDNLIKSLHAGKLENLQLITPTAEQWNQMYQQATGVELRYFRDVPSEVISAFYLDDIDLSRLKWVSRIWVFIQNNQIITWIISDSEQKVMQAQTTIARFHSVLGEIAHQKMEPVDPFYTTGKFPLDTASSVPKFPHAFYLPKESVQATERVYELKKIQIDAMKSWLFNDPTLISRFTTQNGSNVYTDSARLLQYDNQKQEMTYTSSAKATEPASPSLELDRINRFVKKHSGWTGNYLLDRITQNSDNATNHYHFRLIVDGLPVYWPATIQSKNPDLDPFGIELESTEDEVSMYQRSLWYLSSDPQERKAVQLPNKDSVLKLLNQNDIAPTNVRDLFLGYQTEKMSDQYVKLKPVWIVMTANGDLHILSTG
jgi:regulatory protein YycH of two-component signal transduction system YycFG